MNNKIAMESLVMDLKRVAIGYHRNSLKMAQTFYKEAILRKNEIDTTIIKPYMQNLLKRLPFLDNQQDNEAIAEEALLMSILIQNYVHTNL